MTHEDQTRKFERTAREILKEICWVGTDGRTNNFIFQIAQALQEVAQEGFQRGEKETIEKCAEVAHLYAIDISGQAIELVTNFHRGAMYIAKVIEDNIRREVGDE